MRIQINRILFKSTNGQEVDIALLVNIPKINSKGEIRTLDLTGMSRALSPAELPCHILYLYRSNHSHHKPVCNSSVPKLLNYHAISIQFSSAFADSLYFCIKKIK